MPGPARPGPISAAARWRLWPPRRRGGVRRCRAVRRDKELRRARRVAPQLGCVDGPACRRAVDVGARRHGQERGREAQGNRFRHGPILRPVRRQGNPQPDRMGRIGTRCAASEVQDRIERPRRQHRSVSDRRPGPSRRRLRRAVTRGARGRRSPTGPLPYGRGTGTVRPRCPGGRPVRDPARADGGLPARRARSPTGRRRPAARCAARGTGRRAVRGRSAPGRRGRPRDR